MVFTNKAGKRLSKKDVTKVKKHFENEYGKKKGDEVFYATFTKEGLYKREKRMRA